MSKGYTEEEFKTHSTLGGIRAKPAMYIGPTDSNGILHLIKEVADNSIDEFSAGRNNKIVICLDKEAITVADDGAGIPVGKVKDEQSGKVVSVLKAALTLLHAGGKFKGKSGYKQAAGTIGTHGVGIKATNALSSSLTAYTYQKDKWFSIAFEKGKLKQDVEKCKRPKLPFGLKKKDCGVVVRFTPDFDLFKKGSKVPVKRLKEWAKLSAYINGGLEITLIDNGKSKTWKYKHGIAEYLKHQLHELKAGKIGKPFFHNSHHIDLSFQFSDAENINLESYTNSTRNNDAGIHYETVTALIADELKKYGKKRQKFHKQDLLEGIVGVINVKIDNPQFSSQTKEKLVDIRVRKLLEAELPKDLQKFFNTNKNLAKKLCKKAADLRKLKAEFSKKSEALRLLNSRKNKKGILPSKFAAAPRCLSEDRETYLVEGDSAGGTAKEARDGYFQEVLPLKGKILNTMKSKDSKVFENEEVRNIFLVLGFNPKLSNPIDNLRTSKLILMADADPDGRHINTLILTLITKYVPELFEKGIIHILKSPEFCLKHEGKWYYAESRKELNDMLPKEANLKNVMHLKGWGEANSEMLSELAFDKKTRVLYKVKGLDSDSRKEMNLLMGSDSDYRKKLLGI